MCTIVKSTNDGIAVMSVTVIEFSENEKEVLAIKKFRDFSCN